MEDLVELSQLKKDDLIEVLFFDLPPLDHRATESGPLSRWHKYRSAIVVGITRLTLLRVNQEVFLDPPWQQILQSFFLSILVQLHTIVEFSAFSSALRKEWVFLSLF